MATKKAAAARQEVVLQIPDLGLSDKQIAALKTTFKNQLVSSMGAKASARPRIVVVRIRIVFAQGEH
jgi:hypothetical protein